jgi:hypothetical protein
MSRRLYIIHQAAHQAGHPLHTRERTRPACMCSRRERLLDGLLMRWTEHRLRIFRHRTFFLSASLVL